MIEVPSKILSSALTIKAKYQNNIFNDENLKGNTLTRVFDYEIILEKLELYAWGFQV
jgi:hypothetical protein